MDICDYLSERANYFALVKEGEFMVKKGFFYDSDDIPDITSEAMEKILDYFKRKPEKLIEIENMDKEEMSNYLKKAMRNHVINILKRRNRQNKNDIELIKKTIHEEKEKMTFYNLNPSGKDSFGEILNKLRDRKDFGRDCVNDFNVDFIRNNIHFFIEEKFGRSKWNEKKRAIDLFIERYEENISLKDLKKKYVDINIPSLNTEANRIVKGYPSSFHNDS